MSDVEFREELDESQLSVQEGPICITFCYSFA